MEDIFKPQKQVYSAKEMAQLLSNVNDKNVDVDILKHQLQQYKQQIDELKQWLEEQISKCDSKFDFADDYKEYAYKQALSKLKEHDKESGE